MAKKKQNTKQSDNVIVVKMKEDDLAPLDQAEREQGNLTQVLGQMAYKIRLLQLQRDENVVAVTNANQKLNEIKQSCKYKKEIIKN